MTWRLCNCIVWLEWCCELVYFPFCTEMRIWRTDPMPRTRTSAIGTSSLLKDALDKYLCTHFKSHLALAKMTIWWGESRASRFKSPSADVRKQWVSSMWGLSYSQTKLNEEGLIWPECPALLNRTLSLRALLRDNVCFVLQSSEKGVEGDGGPWEIQHSCSGN